MKYNLIFSCLLFVSTQMAAQQESVSAQEPTRQQEQTLFNKAKLRGAWGGA
ncbi:MAG: hypothetical protein Q7T20_19970 [Saprospiraceae bacterium]|nr:hypothetical protein [Saprospiraceae bacterium]